ncbi:FMN-binding negative transcriptional regulator [Acidovorax sp. sic0104]|uniref:FMN-binding negative transcriptional regulator n=1 Tax=Acidovorax sp. sic0104 TaxID=2854784 RepID=UPI001C459082|nr:FMN-binding negative transcriptional regulator [Acidovorax sp. sic0104]MBV7542358.1 FMN-binding negative transcriptional regulator [Acidovorax sp. sic0104]
MHSQPLFQTDDPSELHALMRAHPLATLVTLSTLSREAGLQADLLPLEVVAAPGAAMCLRGHVARPHGMAQSVPDGAQVLAVFQTSNAYISPRWYVNGQRSGRLAPSWNYAAAEARGRLRWVDDAGWVRTHLGALAAAQECGRDQPWSIGDAQPAFIDEAAARLVGFEITVDRLVGKRFLSQQRTEADRRSVVAHLLQEPAGAARDVAGLIVP